MSSEVSGRSCRISDRDSSGATTENDGFSVVAATNNTTRFSTAESSASCCVLENRCTSSMNSTVCSPLSSALRASSMTARTSLTPADSADSASNRRPVACETSAASVVLPLPGGPYRMADATPEPSTRRRSGDPAPASGPARPLRPARPDASAPPAVRRPTRPGRRRSFAARRAGRTDRRTRLQAYHARAEGRRQLRRPRATNPRARASYLLSSGLPSSVRAPIEPIRQRIRTDMSQPPEYPGSPADPYGANQNPPGYPPPPSYEAPDPATRPPAVIPPRRRGYSPPPAAARATSRQRPTAPATERLRLPRRHRLRHARRAATRSPGTATSPPRVQVQRR